MGRAESPAQLFGPAVAIVWRAGDVAPPRSPGRAVAQWWHPGMDASGLYPQEAVAVAGAVAARRREFVTTRWCARRALGQLGLVPGPVPVGAGREPVWPAGVVGALAHDTVLRIAAVAHAEHVTSLGIDVEPNEPLPPEVVAHVLRPAERRRLAALPSGGPAWDRIAFSAKEAVYKTWFPLTRAWLDFTDCEITLSPEGRYTAELAPWAQDRLLAGTVPETQWVGRWMLLRGHIVTGLEFPRIDGIAGRGRRHHQPLRP